MVLVGLNGKTTQLEKPVGRPGVDLGSHRMRLEHGRITMRLESAVFCLALKNVATVRLTQRTDVTLAQLKINQFRVKQEFK